MADLRPAFMDHCKRMFRETSNPLFAWRAIGYALETDFPLPGWCLDFLHDTAFAILAAQNNTDEKNCKPADALTWSLRNALGLSLRSYRQFLALESWPNLDLDIYWDVEEKKERTGQVTKAIESVAANRAMSLSKATKIYYDVKNKLKDACEEEEPTIDAILESINP